MSHRAPNVTWDPPEDKVFDKEVKSVRCWHESGRHRLLIFASVRSLLSLVRLKGLWATEQKSSHAIEEAANATEEAADKADALLAVVEEHSECVTHSPEISLYI